MRFVDEAQIEIASGAGGDGCVSFRREKYVPRGGPNGGNGGRGGSILLVATRKKTSLLDFKFQRHFRAKRGEHGMGKEMDGRKGDDWLIEVPVGTLVYDHETKHLLHDFVTEERPIEIAPGGRGGLGNMNFASSTNQAPRTATPGEPSIQMVLDLELRVMADIGLVGLPNAGKSSLLAAVSRARPKIADYPFTTLAPQLGVAYHKSQPLILADLPGLIEGAAQGAGLGIRFLKHVSRNRLLLHLVDISSSAKEIRKQIAIVRKELKESDLDLTEKETWIVFTKCDLLTATQLNTRRAALKEFQGYFISSATSLGLEPLLDALVERAQTWKTTTEQPLTKEPA